MKMYHPEEYIILDDDEDKYDDAFNEEGVCFTVVWRSSRDSKPV